MSENTNQNNTVNENDEIEANQKPVDKKTKKVSPKDQKISDLEKQLAEINDRYLRMLAEYDNFRKRVTKEKESMYSEGICDSVSKLLTVLDNLERAASVDADNTTSKDVIDGVVKILDQAKTVFESMGVAEIPAKNEKFDPNVHNAVMHEESDEYEENTISDVFLKGYKLGDRVIRHSMVKVMN